jgi:hypothetical protein
MEDSALQQMVVKTLQNENAALLKENAALLKELDLLKKALRTLTGQYVSRVGLWNGAMHDKALQQH